MVIIEIMRFPDLLKRYRERKDYTKTFLAEKVGLSSTYLINVENGRKIPPPLETCESIADALGLSPQEKKEFFKAAFTERNKDKDSGYKEKLGLSGKFETSIKESNVTFDPSPKNLKRVPVISFVQASSWAEAVDSYEPGDGQDFLLIEHEGGEMVFSVIVNGDCMEEEFRQGDKILVDPEKEVQSGDYALIKDLISDEVTFKKVILTEKGGAILQPLNPKYQPIILDSKRKYKIIGKVIKSISEKNFK